ncbi:hypothetical protein LUZ60_003208 [Juncus effusus]|nr:hypothetical protein LUZ60_003208 [Juncus effusus]
MAERVKILTLAELIDLSLPINGAASLHSVSSPPHKRARFDQTLVTNGSSKPDSFTPISLQVLLIGTVNLYSEASNQLNKGCCNHCFCFSDGNCTVCCYILDFNVGIIGREICVTAWNFLPFKHGNNKGVLEIIQWRFSDSDSALNPSFSLLVENFQKTDLKARVFAIGVVKSVSLIFSVPQNNQVQNGENQNSVGFLAEILTCACEICNKNPNFDQNRGSHSFTESKVVYFIKPTHVWRNIIAKLIGRLINISGLLKKMIYVGKKETYTMFVSTVKTKVSVRDFHLVCANFAWLKVLIIGTCVKTSISINSFAISDIKMRVKIQDKSLLGKFVESLKLSARFWVLIMITCLRRKFAGISYPGFIRKIIPSEDIGCVLIGNIKTCSSGLKLVDAAGSINIVIPDLISNLNNNTIFEIREYKLVIEGCATQTEISKYDFGEPLSLRAIFNHLPNEKRKNINNNLTFYVQFNIKDSISLSQIPSNISDNINHGEFHLLFISHKFPPINHIQSEPSLFAEALISPYNFNQQEINRNNDNDNKGTIISEFLSQFNDNNNNGIKSATRILLEFKPDNFSKYQVKICGKLNNWTCPVGFGPGAIVTFHRVLLTRMLNQRPRLILTPTTYVEIFSIEEFSENNEEQNSQKFLQNSFDDFPFENLKLSLFSELKSCFNGTKLAKFNCRVLAVKMLVLEKCDTVQKFKIPLAGFILDDGSSTCCCWADESQANTLLRLLEISSSFLSIYSSSSKNNNKNNNNNKKIGYCIERMLDRHKKVTVKNEGNSLEISSRNVSFHSDASFSILEEKVLNFIMLKASQGPVFSVVGSLMDANALRQFDKNIISEPYYLRRCMKNIWVREVLHIDPLKEASNMLRNLMTRLLINIVHHKLNYHRTNSHISIYLTY